MMPANSIKNTPILGPADNCSAADTSIDDRTLASVTSNAISISSSHALPEKLLRGETSPRPKHRAISGDTPAIENWRPNVTTIKEKSTDSAESAGSAVDRPYISREPVVKAFAKASASSFTSFQRRQPTILSDSDARASAETHATDIDDYEDLASFFKTGEEGYHSSLLVPLEEGRPEDQVAGDFSFSNLSRLPLLPASRCERAKEHLYSPAPDSSSPSQLDFMNFSFPSRSRLPLYTVPRPPVAASTRHPPQLQALPPHLQAVVREKLKPGAGDKQHAAAAILLECLSGPKAKYDDFKFPSTARLPLYTGFQETVTRRSGLKAVDSTGFSYAARDVSLHQRSRLPLHLIAGAENKRLSFKPKQRLDRPASERDNNYFEFKRGPRLHPYSSFFKGPIETRLLATQLARKDAPVQVPELAKKTKKAHVFGSIDSVGEFIRPNVDNSFLFSITPFSKLEIREKKRTNEVLFGKLERAGWKTNKHADPVKTSKPESGKEASTTAFSFPQTVPTTISEEAGLALVGVEGAPTTPMSGVVKERPSRDQQSTEDRNRFDALVTRLQQKLSERSQSDCRSTSTTLRRAHGSSNTGSSQTRSASRSMDSRNTRAVDGSGTAKETVQPRACGQLLAHGSGMNYGTISSPIIVSGAGASSNLSNHAASEAKESTQLPKDEQPYVPASKGMQHQALVSSLPAPGSFTIHSTAPPPLSGFSAPPVMAVPNERNWMSVPALGQMPISPQGLPVPFPNFPEQSATAGMLPQPGMWQAPPLPLPHYLPQASAPLAYPVPAPMGQNWQVQKRPKHKRRAPYVALNAAEQQKIEEHIELLKSTIPNFATVSKRRQQIRWEKQQEKVARQNTMNNGHMPPPYPTGSMNWQQQYPPQHRQIFHQHPTQQIPQGPQYYQPNNTVMAPPAMQPYLPRVQQFPASMPLGACTWPMAGMNMF